MVHRDPGGVSRGCETRLRSRSSQVKSSNDLYLLGLVMREFAVGIRRNLFRVRNREVK